ncbi:MAG: sulfate/molybdate ABC transporter ATP-binding protein [Marmoricola sp.]
MTLLLAASVTDRDLDISFEVAAGETVALLGPNGAGKSTALAVLAGLLRPDAGTVVLDGRTLVDTATRTDVAPHRRSVALLAQDPLLFPHLSVRENVAFGPRSAGASRSRSRDLADHWLAETGVADLAHRRPGQVSGGQAQRIAVARALATDPALLLLDEPMASLDVSVTPALRQTLRRVLADRTAVIVTHDVLDALLLADRVVVLEGGRVVEDGPTRDVLSRPRSRFAADLAGLNLLAGTWDGSCVVLPDRTRVQGLPTGPVPAPGDRVVATFAPHAVAVHREPAGGSPRNSFAVRIAELEPLGDRVRLRSGWLSADVTLDAVADLGLAPDLGVTFVVKATEVAVYGLG